MPTGQEIENVRPKLEPVAIIDGKLFHKRDVGLPYHGRSERVAARIAPGPDSGDRISTDANSSVRLLWKLPEGGPALACNRSLKGFPLRSFRSLREQQKTENGGPLAKVNIPSVCQLPMIQLAGPREYFSPWPTGNLYG